MASSKIMAAHFSPIMIADKTVMDILPPSGTSTPSHAFSLNNVYDYHDPHTRFKPMRTEASSWS
jgi:hypothetical protein